MFSQPPNTLSNYVLGGSAIYYIHRIYIIILVGLRHLKSSDARLIFAQFKHCKNVSLLNSDPPEIHTVLAALANVFALRPRDVAMSGILIH